MKTKDQLIQKHPAWRENIDAFQAEKSLSEKLPFTYLLRKGDRGNEYFISFVKEDNSIYHQSFTLEYDLKGWYYKNCTPRHPVETLEEIIPQMMHCSSEKCLVLARF